ncbi:MAG: hypothetical protein Q4F57_09460 [Weeksellaceae bacterium]|nr:hypothetical protein [Weeksellaceae bacterium]
MIRHELKKITHYEFWPFWIYYIPMIPVYLKYVWKSGKWLYFTTVNPDMKYGGFFGYSKSEAQNMLPKEYLPESKSLLLSPNETLETPFEFPFIIKPDVGERGKGVNVIYNQREWTAFTQQHSGKYIAQHWYDSLHEFGLFFVKMPDAEKGKIVSITGKEFLIYHGDGESTLRQLIEENSRAYYRKAYLYLRFHDRLEEPLPAGEHLLLEEIGNHNRGTRFYDAGELWTQELEDSLNHMLQNIPNFCYGRLDVKAQNVESLKKGDFTVIEINGANSEATHVYDTKYTLRQSYGEVKKHLQYQFEVAQQQLQRGVRPESKRQFLKDLFQHLTRH